MRTRLKYILIYVWSVFVIISCGKDPGPVVEPPTPPPPSPSGVTLAKKEMRAVWIATVWELDWPQGVYSMEAQKKKYTDYLDKFVKCNINAVFVQIRPTADAFYNSTYESWSKSITGVAGQDPGYDVLAFMINEAHARNLEFHAWMNPYRISTRASASSPFPTLDPKISPTLVKDYNTIRIYNPALPEVHDRITNIIKDVITKYDVDGIHLDDYFYPDPAAYTTLNDATEYATYGSEYATIDDFRKGNVSKVIQKIYNLISTEKPGVVFSVSPASSNEYNQRLFADVTKWCQEGWVDVIIPQIYSATGTSASSFNLLVSWWQQYCYKAVPMVGYALYKFGDPTQGSSWQSTSELVSQFKLANAQSKMMGSVMYSAAYFNSNKLGIIDVLKSEIYTNPAVIPFVGRKTIADPTPASGIEQLSGNKIKWNRGNNLRTVIYKIDSDNKASVVAITSATEYTLPGKGDYCLTTLNKDNSESAISDIITIN